MSDTNGTLNGVAVIDRQGHKIGKVVDVFHDLISGDAEWVAVKTGPLNAHHPFVPVQGTYRADNGDLVVPFDKTTIVQATRTPASPRAPRGRGSRSPLRAQGRPGHPPRPSPVGLAAGPSQATRVTPPMIVGCDGSHSMSAVDVVR